MNPEPLVFALLMMLAFGIVTGAWGCLRTLYLKKSQSRVCLDFSKEVTLHHAFWSYGLVVMVFAFTLGFIIPIFSHPNTFGRIFTFGILSIMFFGLGLFHFIRKFKSRVVIGIGKQMTYFDSIDSIGLETIYLGQVDKYYVGPFSFVVKIKGGNVIKIPTNIKHAELIMGFLEMSVKENSK